MAGFTTQAARLGGKLLGRAGLGVGLGYGVHELSGEDDPYTLQNLLLDGSLGTLLPAGRVLSPSKREALLATRLGGTKAGSMLLGGGRPFRGLIDLGLITSGHLGGHESQPAPLDPGPPEKVKAGSKKGSTTSSGRISLEDLGLTVNPVVVNYQPGAAPSFHKTLKDYLADKQLQGLVNQNIFATNLPLLQANKTEGSKRARKHKQNEYVQAGLMEGYDKRLKDQIAMDQASAQRAAARRQLLDAQTDQAAESVPNTYLDGEAGTAKAAADTAAANESAISDSLIDRLAQAGQSYLQDLKGAQQAQGRVDDQKIDQDANDAIRANVDQIRANQAQRGTLLGTLAAEQLKNDIDLYNTNIQNYNSGEDRRYNAAATNADMEFKSRLANAESNMGLLEATSKSEGGGELTEAQKRGSARIKALQLKYDEAKTKVAKNSHGVQVQWSSTPEGKRQLRALKHQISQLKKKYGI